MTAPRGPVGRIVAELRRRHVFRTVALYIVAAWGLMQVADVLLPALALPETSIRYVLLATIAGFPLAVVVAWFFDVTASGIRRTAAIEAEAAEVEPLKALDYALIAALLVVLAAVGYGLSGAVLERPAAPAKAPEAVGAVAAGPPMVGVLPFAHLGGSEDGAFFATGIHDDLLTRLAKLGGLRVVSRTSVLGYANTTKRIPEIGRELRADAILEGGVRIAGDRIRINAQLIDARSDEHLWAETYDRQLTASNIFDVQSNIARAIAAALQAALTPADSAELALIPTDNMAAYRAYHEIMQWSWTVDVAHDDSNRKRYREGLRRSFELDPDFTRPMVELVAELSRDVYFDREDARLDEAEALIARIGEVAPGSADHLAAQSLYVYYVLRDFDRAEALVRAAREKAPSDTRLLEIRSWINRRQGDFDAWLQASLEARNLDPRNERLASIYIHRLVLLHRYDEASAELRTLENPLEPDRFNRSLLELRAHHKPGRYARELASILGPLEDQQHPRALVTLWEARLAARDFDGAQRTVDRVTAMLEAQTARASAPLALMPNELALQLGQSLLTNDVAKTRTVNAHIKRVMGLTGLVPAAYPEHLHPLDRAQLALVEGEPAMTVAVMNAYWQDPTLDRAEWLGTRRLACQLLALAGAAGEAVACLRDALAGPSDAHPFLEPLMPFYDEIRDTRAFQTLADELVHEGWLAGNPVAALPVQVTPAP